MMNRSSTSITIASPPSRQKMQKQAAIDIINERNKTYYNPLKVRNISFFDDAYNLYTKNKDDLSKVSTKLGEYAEKWAGDSKSIST